MAVLETLIPYVNATLNQILADEKEKECRLKEQNHVLLVIMENQMEKTVYVQWGKAKDGAVSYGDYIPVPPKTAIGRRIHVQDSNLSSQRPTVRVCKEQNRTGPNVISLLWQPGDHHHTKVFIITETEITEQRDPEVRNWVTGEFDLYQDAKDLP